MTSTTARPIRRRTFLSVTLASAVAAVTGCGFTGRDDAPDGSSTNGSDDPLPVGGALRQSMTPVPHIDPVFDGSGAVRGNLLQTGLLEGLVVRDPDNGSNVLPGVAEDWTISDNLLVHTFTLRSDAVWSNGDPVTADDFVWNWRRALSPDTQAQSEQKMSANEQMKNVVGAAAFFGGSVTDFSTVGVKALDEQTLEITLETPDPLFMPNLAEWRTLPLHPATLEANPDDWFTPDKWVGNGAFVMDEWRANAGATLVRNDSYWDIDSYPIHRWEVTFNDGGDTAQMIAYQADEIDTFRVEEDPAAITNDPQLFKQLVMGEPSQFRCLVVMNSKNTLLEDVRIRKALSLAIDRESIATVAPPDVPATSLVPSGVDGYDQVQVTTFDAGGARDLLAQAGYPDGDGIPTLNLLTPRPSPWLEAVADMWREHLGVEAAIDLVETGVYLERRLAVHPAEYVGFSYGNFGITPPTLYKALSNTRQFGQFALPAAAADEYYATQNSTNISPANKQAVTQRLIDDETFPEFATYIELVEQAKAAATDPEVMNDLLIQAATAREEAYIVLPVLWGGYTFMVKPRVHDLTITSLPDQVFTLKGVTVADT